MPSAEVRRLFDHCRDRYREIGMAAIHRRQPRTWSSGDLALTLYEAGIALSSRQQDSARIATAATELESLKNALKLAS